jgi:hypothetical protein
MYNSPDFETASLISGEARLIHINHDQIGDMYYGVELSANSFSLVQSDISDETFDTTIVVVCSDPNAVNYGANGDCQFTDEDGNEDGGDVTEPGITGCTANGCPTGQECIDGQCKIVEDDPIFICQSDTQCGPEGYCSYGMCLAKLDFGTPCEENNYCKAGLECVPSYTDQVKRCLLTINSICTDSGSCATGLCFHDKCSNYITSGGRCEVINNLSNCVPGTVCNCITTRFGGSTCTCG